MVMQRWHRVALRRVSAPPASRFTHAHHLAHLRHTRRCCQGLLARRGTKGVQVRQMHPTALVHWLARAWRRSPPRCRPERNAVAAAADESPLRTPSRQHKRPQTKNTTTQDADLVVCDSYDRAPLIANRAEYEAMHAESVRDPSDFWAKMAADFYWVSVVVCFGC